MRFPSASASRARVGHAANVTRSSRLRPPSHPQIDFLLSHSVLRANRGEQPNRPRFTPRGSAEPSMGLFWEHGQFRGDVPSLEEHHCHHGEGRRCHRQPEMAGGQAADQQVNIEVPRERRDGCGTVEPREQGLEGVDQPSQESQPSGHASGHGGFAGERSRGQRNAAQERSQQPQRKVGQTMLATDNPRSNIGLRIRSATATTVTMASVMTPTPADCCSRTLRRETGSESSMSIVPSRSSPAVADAALPTAKTMISSGPKSE